MKVTFALALILAAGCSSSENGTTPDTNVDASSAAFDKEFIDMMTPHHQSAVEMATIAQTRGEHAEIKALAGAIISAQQKEITQLKSWRKAWYGSDQTPAISAIPMLDGMDHGKMQDMMMSIEMLKTATPFDPAFISEMIPHHASAIEAAKLAQQKAQHAEIKALAADIISSQQREIDQMTAWRMQWYGMSMDGGTMQDAGRMGD